MPKLSACIIAFNEEASIRACIESVSFCDEVLVVDSHSTDRTREIATEVGARVVEHDFEGHIQQKNFAIESAAHDWVLSLDADERCSEAMQAEVTRLMSEEGGASVDGGPPGFSFARRNRYLGRWIYHGGWYPDRKVRLFDRRRGQWGGTNPHDHVVLQGEGRALRSEILHESYRDLRAHMKTIDNFTSIAAREKLKKGVRFLPLYLLLSGPLRFLKMYVLKLGILDGWPGLVCASMGAWYEFLKYAKLYELRYVKDPEVERTRSSYDSEKDESA
ncbi:MAG: glycosyltransferase family 2 protein [Planctomycetota bacterium]|jgi:glycosyltransferase involved in cell wall biosynthesis